MKIIKSIIKLGNSKVISLPKEIANKVNFGEKHLFNLELIETINLEESLKEYRCVKCELRFIKSQGEDRYCPACGCDTIEEIEDD